MRGSRGVTGVHKEGVIPYRSPEAPSTVKTSEAKGQPGLECRGSQLER